MQVVRSILAKPLEMGRPAVTMGTFDGLHRGHVAIIARLVAVAGAEARAAVAVTFHPHPQRVLADVRAPKLLSTLEERLARFEQLKVETVVVIPFDREFSRWPAEKFIAEVLLGKLAAGHLVVGYDHAFGHDRRGKTDLLRTTLARHRIPLEVVSPVKDGDGPIKSSRIRRLLAAGELDVARRLLGYAYHFSGTCIRGRGRGARLGFPTANLSVPPEKLIPPDGIYGATARLEGSDHHALVHIGPRPTVGEIDLSVEVHLLDFPSRDLYGATITVTPEVALRKVEALSDLNALAGRIQQDRRAYEAYLDRKEKPRAS